MILVWLGTVHVPDITMVDAGSRIVEGGEFDGKGLFKQVCEDEEMIPRASITTPSGNKLE
jgi:hypothetical protein